MASYNLGRCLLGSLLKVRKMSQTECAKRVNLPKQQINHYVHNRATMSLENAISIALAIECRVEELYELIPIKSNEKKRTPRQE